MGKSKAPKAPDPQQTSAAQTGTSVSTAIANAALGNVNQVGADGSTLNYDQTGSHSFTDPYTNNTYEVPTYTATQSLSDKAQGIYDANQDAEGNLANTARDQSAFLQDYLSKPFDGDTSAIESHLFDLGSRTLDPKFAEQKADLQTQLSNQGIKLGSAAYDRAMGQMSDNQSNAYSSLALQGRGQAFSELQAARNQPINEISALLSGSQVSMPNYATNQPAQIATTDNAGIINQNYQQQMDVWQQKQQSLGGMFSTLGTLGGAAIMSDKRTKEDIHEVGKTNDGQKIYQYRYKSGGPIQMGLMAQDVEKKRPEAVETQQGIKMVNYGKALAGAR